MTHITREQATWRIIATAGALIADLAMWSGNPDQYEYCDHIVRQAALAFLKHLHHADSTENPQ